MADSTTYGKIASYKTPEKMRLNTMYGHMAADEHFRVGKMLEDYGIVLKPRPVPLEPASEVDSINTYLDISPEVIVSPTVRDVVLDYDPENPDTAEWLTRVLDELYSTYFSDRMSYGSFLGNFGQLIPSLTAIMIGASMAIAYYDELMAEAAVNEL